MNQAATFSEGVLYLEDFPRKDLVQCLVTSPLFISYEEMAIRKGSEKQPDPERGLTHQSPWLY